MPVKSFELEFTVVVTVVDGKECTRTHLTTLCPQMDFKCAEVLVPYDKWSEDVGSLADEFPEVVFHFSEHLGLENNERISKSDHVLYDRRRSIGLHLSRGKIVALTEDRAIPEKDWAAQMLKAHLQPYEVIGGAVENGVERSINRALYFCDFGRYGRPFHNHEVSYVSDVNLAYKREALDLTKDLWAEYYHETTVNWTLQSHGKKLYLDCGPVVYQCRRQISLWNALKERVVWGRVFARTRVERLTYIHRLLFAGAVPLLPLILLFRALQHMIRQGEEFKKIVVTMPLISLFVFCWSVGELAGYLTAGANLKRPLWGSSGTNREIRNNA